MLSFHLLSKINNQSYNFFTPLTIFQACLTKKIFIPRFCYHVSLKIAGNCRMCLIEEKASIKPLASCAVTLMNGLQLFTNTEVVKKAREGVLEYLLINHPLDCPICDQGGECDLQDQTMVFGSDKGRFYDIKRSTSNKNLGVFVKTFLNRCIHCARCTRFLTDIAGTPELQLLGRGYKTEISNYIIQNLISEVSGNIIDLCPVGALTSKPYAFKARVWELMSFFSYDLMDAFATNVQIDFRGLELLRILPKTNKYLNDEWITDKTRFYYDGLNVQRLTSIFVRDVNYNVITWNQGLFFLKNHLFHYFSSFTSKKIKIVNNYGSFLDLESSYFIRRLTSFFGNNLFLYLKKNRNSDFRFLYSLTFFWKLATTNSWDNYKIYLFDTNLRYESPITNLKLRKIITTYHPIIYIFGFLSNLNVLYTHLTSKLSKSILNILFFSTEFLIIKGWNNYNSFSFTKNTNTVAYDISDVSSSELNLNTTFIDLNLMLPNFFLNLGYPHNSQFSYFFPLIINIFHHVKNEIIENINIKSKLIFFPTKFYIEKAASYISNVVFFFNTINPFSYALRNTKEEWKILNSFLEYNFSFFLFNDIQKNVNMISPKLQKLLIFFTFEFDFYYIKANSHKSKITEYFRTNIVAIFSFSLQLAAQYYKKLNDYIFIS